MQTGGHTGEPEPPPPDEGGGGGGALQATAASAVSLVPSAKLMCARNGHDPFVHPVELSAEAVPPCVGCGAGCGAGFVFRFAQWRNAR
jgi:hypothetical protein